MLDAYRIQIGANEYNFMQQMLYVQLSLEIYRMHVGGYPSERNNLESLVSRPQILEGTGVWRGPYAVTNSVFYDPWGRKLQYKLDETGKADLRCLGRDGVPSEDDICARDAFPDIYRELEKLPEMGPIPIPAASD
ncbi:MAG: type II secretion system protein GspG [Candidatus Omnitrophica bacterium]|nr:type II secretion system protein GspG [Candidatus Omnitrophota bacterium]